MSEQKSEVPKTTSIKDAVKDANTKPQTTAKKTTKRQTKPSTVPAKVDDFKVFRAQLTKYDEKLVKILSEENQINKDKFMIVAENAVRRNPKLLEADRSSLFAAILTAAEFGLEPNTPAGLSYMIPYFNKDFQRDIVEFQIGYHGFTNLMFRHPRVKKITTELVYYKDKFRRWMDDTMNWRFEFEPAPDDERVDRKGAFAIVHLEGADPAFLYLSAQKIEEIKAKSKSPHVYDPKNDPEGWMWKKATIRQIAKTIPKGTPALGNAINVDSMIESGAMITLDSQGQTIIHKPKEKGRTSKDKLNKIFGDNIPEAEYAEQ